MGRSVSRVPLLRTTGCSSYTLFVAKAMRSARVGGTSEGGGESRVGSEGSRQRALSKESEIGFCAGSKRREL